LVALVGALERGLVLVVRVLLAERALPVLVLVR
jgi:hypothetical protein